MSLAKRASSRGKLVINITNSHLLSKMNCFLSEHCSVSSGSQLGIVASLQLQAVRLVARSKGVLEHLARTQRCQERSYQKIRIIIGTITMTDAR